MSFPVFMCSPFAQNPAGNHSNMDIAAWRYFSGWYIGHMGGYNTPWSHYPSFLTSFCNYEKLD